MTVPILLGVEWWPEPAEQPADRTSLQQYDIDGDVLNRWREARTAYMAARTALLRQIERQGFRATPRPRGAGFVDVVFSGPPDADPPRLVEVEDEHGRSVRYGQWVERDDGPWVLRFPRA